MGNKKTPIEIRALRMTGKRAGKLLRAAPPSPAPLLDAPAWLTADQKTAWEFVIQNAPKHVLNSVDRGVLAAFVVAEDTHKQAALGLAQTSLLSKLSAGRYPVQSEYLPILNRQAVLMVQFASQLGFTPCSRARLDSGKTPVQAAASDWDEIARVN